MTMLVVSHDVPSTMRMADWMLLLLPERAVEGEPRALATGADRDAVEFLTAGEGTAA
jgi:ABC-type transporter Mla maintaining outer membrane lipid asymmetry ATPase subunit MlaF